MEKVLLRSAALTLASFFMSEQAKALEPTTPPTLLPIPAQVSWGEGRLALTAQFMVAIAGVKEDRVQGAVQRLLNRLKKRTGLGLASSAEASADKAMLVIQCKEKSLPIQSVKEDESYSLTVAPTQAQLSAPNPLGILRGLETLLQLVLKDDKGGIYIPCVTIQDKPRFPWRGLLIDACRHWQPVEVIKRNLDGLAEAKMNVLHWHLSEDQAFRVESKKFPKLHELGSEGKYYTQDEIKEVVAYARDRGIRVVPEFDVPGHFTAWLVGYPELASGPGPYQIEKKYGILSPAMDPTREEIYKFLDAFIQEMTGLFPDPYFHIGGDEVDGRQWNENPRIQAFMYEHNMKSNEDLQTYFNSRLLKLVDKYGKHMVGWDEIFQPDLPKTIVVHSWRGAESLEASAKQGYDTILSNGYYLDNMRSAAFHYAVDPIPAKTDLTKEQQSHILGGEACMWSEYVSFETIDSRIWPRLLAVAERLWSPAEVRDAGDFYRRMGVESARLDELGLTHNSNYLPLLKGLVGDQPVEPLKTLADVLEPVKLYERYHQRTYSSDTPLDHIIDAVRPESLVARGFRLAVEAYLAGAPKLGSDENLRSGLRVWVDNHKALEPILAKADLYNIANQSRDLAAISTLALEALDHLRSGKPAPPSWQEKASKALDRAQHIQAEVEIAVIPAIRKLVLTAGQLDKLKKESGGEWNQSLDEQVKAAKRKSWE